MAEAAAPTRAEPARLENLGPAKEEAGQYAAAAHSHMQAQCASTVSIAGMARASQRCEHNVGATQHDNRGYLVVVSATTTCREP